MTPLLLTLALNAAPTYTKDIRPLMAQKCFMCHGGTSRLPNFKKYDIAYTYRNKIRMRVFVNKTMPMGIPITDAQRKKFADWVDGGAKK